MFPPKILLAPPNAGFWLGPEVAPKRVLPPAVDAPPKRLDPDVVEGFVPAPNSPPALLVLVLLLPKRLDPDVVVGLATDPKSPPAGFEASDAGLPNILLELLLVVGLLKVNGAVDLFGSAILEENDLGLRILRLAIMPLSTGEDIFALLMQTYRKSQIYGNESSDKSCVSLASSPQHTSQTLYAKRAVSIP